VDGHVSGSGKLPPDADYTRTTGGRNRGSGSCQPRRIAVRTAAPVRGASHWPAVNQVRPPAPPAAGGGAPARARRSGPLPPGALLIGGTLGFQGVTTYGFLVIAHRALGATAYSPFSVLWALIFVAAPGLFLPLEQEVGRAASARRVAGLGAGPVVRRALYLGIALALAVMVAAAAGEAPLVASLFDGDAGLLAGFMVAIACYALYYLGRGTLAGAGRFGGYASVLTVEGVARVGAAAVLWRLGVRSGGTYGLAIALPCMVGLLAVLPRQRGIAAPGPPARWSELTAALGWLLTGSLLAQVIINIAPLAFQALFGGSDKAAAGEILNGLIIARIPLFLFQAVQAALMPKLAGDAAAGRIGDFTALLRRLLLLVAAVVVVSVVGIAVLGPPVLHLLFPSSHPLSRGDLVLLGLGSEGMMAALTLAYATIALRGYPGATAAWGAGIVALVAALVVLPGTLVRVEVAFCVGVLVASVAMAVALRVRVARAARPGPVRAPA
jgi:O-antigen/teichoic acid export membrane protein